MLYNYVLIELVLAKQEAGKKYGEGHPKAEVNLETNKPLSAVDSLQMIVNRVGISRPSSAKIKTINDHGTPEEIQSGMQGASIARFL